MLVLTRKQDEALLIMTPSGEIIRITVKNIRKNSVRLTFEAAKEVRVVRDEIFEKYSEMDTSNLGTNDNGLPRQTRGLSIDAQVDGHRLADL